MLKIGAFSKLSMLTGKALRFYEREGFLIPSAVDAQTGYRFYETCQPETAAKIKALRQLDYGFCEYLDGEHKESNITVRYSQAVVQAGIGNARIQFRTLPAVLF